MPHESRNHRTGGHAGRSGRSRRRRLLYRIGGAAAVLAILAMAVLNERANARHPAPRADMDQSEHIVSAERYAAHPRVAHTYQVVAAVPEIIDGIFCYCMCSEHSGHYSLLDCFASDHAARCDVCLSEAMIAYQMSRDGKDLKAIRAEIDDRFQS